MSLPSGVAVEPGHMLFQPRLRPEEARRVRGGRALDLLLPPATSLDPPPQPASRATAAASTPARRRCEESVDFGIFIRGDLSLRDDGTAEPVITARQWISRWA